jgi:hypothetical protein
MSNEMIPLNSNALASAQNAFGDADFTKDIAQKSFARIGIKGGSFRMYNGKQEVAVSEFRSMDVIVVAAAKDVHREYYEGAYVEGVEATPVCWSANGRTPDPKAPSRQAGSCEQCPKNAKGSGAQGSRACKFAQRIAVVLPHEIEGTVYAMKLPAMSIFGETKNGFMPFKPYMTYLATQKAPVSALITEMKFDQDAAVPKLGFRPRQKDPFVGDANIPLILAQMKSDAASNAIELRVVQKDAGPSVAKAEVAPTPAAPAPAKPEKKAEPLVPPSASTGAMSAALGEWGDDN